MEAVEAESEMPLFQYWADRWNTSNTGWQIEGVFSLLEKHQDLILAGKKDAQVYIPMCGTAHELKWFYAKGHRVVGVEFVESVALKFFNDNGLPVEEAVCPVLKCKIFQTPDKRIRIFVCSVLDFNGSCAGEMDIVWDRGGLSSIEESLRERYIAVIKSLLAPNYSYGLWGAIYDEGPVKEFPRSMPEPVLRKLFGDDVKLACVEQLPPRPAGFTPAMMTECLWHVTA